MIDVGITGVGVHQMTGLPEDWRLIYEGPCRDGLFELCVSCPRQADLGWLKRALMDRDIVRVTTPAHVTQGPLHGFEIECFGRSEDETRREVILKFIAQEPEA